MKTSFTPVVTIHPYFKVHPGKMDAALALLPRFVQATSAEAECHNYEFTRNGDEIFCREGYANAQATLNHLTNVSALLGEMLQNSSLTRLEIHGPAEELDQLRKPLADLNPAWFVRLCGIKN